MRNVATYESFISKLFKKKVDTLDVLKLEDDVEYILQSFIDDNPNIKTQIKSASIKFDGNKIAFNGKPSSSVLGNYGPDIKFVYDEKNCVSLQIFSTILVAREFLNNKKDTIESMNLNYEIFNPSLNMVWVIFWYNK